MHLNSTKRDRNLYITGQEIPICRLWHGYNQGYNPYAADNTWTARDREGREYIGAEVTSEGFHIYGLDPYRYYSAGYACYLSDVSSRQDSWDIWDNSMPIANVKNGQVIDKTYFRID